MPALAGEPSSISALPVILAPSENLGLLATAQAASLDEKHKPLVMNSLLHSACPFTLGNAQRSAIR